MWTRAAANHLAVGAQLEAQHAVRRGMLRAHVEDHLVGVGIGLPAEVGRHQLTCLLGGVKSKGPMPIFSPAMKRSAICVVGFTRMPL